MDANTTNVKREKAALFPKRNIWCSSAWNKNCGNQKHCLTDK